MPRLAPVTRATRSCRPNVISLFSNQYLPVETRPGRSAMAGTSKCDRHHCCGQPRCCCLRRARVVGCYPVHPALGKISMTCTRKQVPLGEAVVGDPGIGMRSRSALYVCVALLDHGADRDVVQDLVTRRLSKSTESLLHPRTKCLREAVETASRRV